MVCTRLASNNLLLQKVMHMCDYGETCLSRSYYTCWLWCVAVACVTHDPMENIEEQEEEEEEEQEEEEEGEDEEEEED